MDTSLRQALKARAHHLKPVILLGAKGLTSPVLEETDNALTVHELIKIKINGAAREDRIEMFNSICEQLQAELVQIIGTIAIVYRENKED